MSSIRTLLADIRDIFHDRNTDRMFTRQIVEALTRLSERPWSELRGGKSISDNWLSKQLRGFGLGSRSVRIGTDTGKWYYLDDFTDALSVMWV